jgi:hypothetical protein
MNGVLEKRRHGAGGAVRPRREIQPAAMPALYAARAEGHGAVATGGSKAQGHLGASAPNRHTPAGEHRRFAEASAQAQAGVARDECLEQSRDVARPAIHEGGL